MTQGAADSAPPSRSEQQPAKRRGAGRNLPVAIVVAALLLVWIIGSLLWLPWVFIVFLIAAAVAGSYEIINALGKVHLNGVYAPVAIGSPIMLVVAHRVGQSQGQFAAAAVVLAGTALMVLTCLIARIRGPVRGFVGDAAASIFTIGYVPMLLATIVLLLAQPQGNLRVLLYFILVPCCDTGAYAFGSLFGKHKMAPHISPGKTWEGLAGGVLTAGLVGALVAPPMIGASWWAGALIGVMLGLAGATGDLIESMLKRDAGLKDMSRLLPGHGGAMDRLDSLLVAAPMAWMSMLVLVP